MTDLPKTWHQRIEQLLSNNTRIILGIAGTPGSGKSSLATAITSAFAPIAVNVPMDGFHLANAELERLGRRNRKGAPDTFDVEGYAALLRAIRSTTKTTVYAPLFNRGLEEPLADAIAVLPSHQLIVTEGNYLLGGGPWAAIRPLLDQCWYVDINAAQRIERLIARHILHGKAPDIAKEWVLRSDEANAKLIEQTKALADTLITWPPAG